MTETAVLTKIQIGKEVRELLLEDGFNDRDAPVKIHKYNEGRCTMYQLYHDSNVVRWVTPYDENGNRDGAAYNYDKTGGVIQSIRFSNNKKNGYWIKHQNGVARSSQRYKGDVAYGPYTIFNENKELLEKGFTFGGVKITREDLNMMNKEIFGAILVKVTPERPEMGG